jgi:hypothetical protein
MLQELLAMMTPEERVAEFGTVEEKRAYIAEKRLENPNWVNTIFPPGKDKRNVAWTPCHRGMARGYVNASEDTVMNYGRRKSFSARNGAKPRNARKSRAH